MDLFHEFHSGDIHVRFLVDGKFTLCWAKYRDKNAFGVSCCSPRDDYDGTIGMWVSFARLCKNLKLNRQQRVEFAHELQASVEALYADVV